LLRITPDIKVDSFSGKIKTRWRTGISEKIRRGVANASSRDLQVKFDCQLNCAAIPEIRIMKGYGTTAFGGQSGLRGRLPISELKRHACGGTLTMSTRTGNSVPPDPDC
jgi:hypothetical protein